MALLDKYQQHRQDRDKAQPILATESEPQRPNEGSTTLDKDEAGPRSGGESYTPLPSSVKDPVSDGFGIIGMALFSSVFMFGILMFLRSLTQV